MSTPWIVILLLFFYIFLVLVGQRIMRKRDSFDIKRILIIYNSLLVILSLYMLREVGLYAESLMLDMSPECDTRS